MTQLLRKLTFLALGIVAASCSQPLLVPVASHTATPAPESWVILPDMPASATQADIGAELYSLVCQACHGNRGQGLTQDWLATWAPQDQNCWQSKCHSANHPSDSFQLPVYVPALIGEKALARFDTALDLHDYMRETQPWCNPASMLDEEYWQLTAFLLRSNQIDCSLTAPLNQDSAAGIQLHPTD